MVVVPVVVVAPVIIVAVAVVAVAIAVAATAITTLRETLEGILVVLGVVVEVVVVIRRWNPTTATYSIGRCYRLVHPSWIEWMGECVGAYVCANFSSPRSMIKQKGENKNKHPPVGPLVTFTAASIVYCKTGATPPRTYVRTDVRTHKRTDARTNIRTYVS